MNYTLAITVRTLLLWAVAAGALTGCKPAPYHECLRWEPALKRWVGSDDCSGSGVRPKPRPADPVPPVQPPAKGNASANNGKGGNYDRTGHSDNGRGNGRNR